MNALLILLLSCPAAEAPPLAAATPVALQDDEQPPEDGRESIKELIEQLEKHVKQRGKQDQEAVEVIKQLVAQFPVSGPKDRASMIKALDKCLKQKRPEVDGVRQNALFLQVAEALQAMAPESMKVALSWVDHKSHRDDLALQRALIRAVGASKSDDAIKPLVKLLTHHEAQIQAATAEALGEYENADQKDRKDIFDALLKLMMSVKGRVDNDYNDTSAKRQWDVIRAPIITTLQRLSGAKETSPDAWQRWWNKNKRENWDA